MPTKDATTFVLWAERFDETSATIFTTQLRQFGCRVKLVGVGGVRSKGMHGLSLAPDVMLDQALALANHANCVIFPCSMTGLHYLKNDPRITEFLRRAERNHARFFVGSLSEFNTLEGASAMRPADPAPLVAQITEYPTSEHLIGFVRELAYSLLAPQKSKQI